MTLNLFTGESWHVHLKIVSLMKVLLTFMLYLFKVLNICTGNLKVEKKIIIANYFPKE